MLLLIAAIQAAGDTYDIDSVCVNATRNYRVNGEVGSTYEWLLTDAGGNPVTLSNPSGSTFTETTSGTTLYGSEITISWPTPGLFSLMSVQTSVFGCDSIQLGQIKVFDLPFADAGKDAIICPGAPHALMDATAFNYSTLLWIGGDGAFDDATTLTPTYTPGPNDLLAGIVTLTLTAQGKGNGETCTPYSSSVTLTILRLEAAVQPTDITCYGSTDGKIEISGATGGSGNYQFSIDGINWTSNSLFTNLSKGKYQVLMRDAMMPVCFAILVEVEIIEPEQLAADSPPDHTDVTCIGNDGTISVLHPTGGSGSYEFSLDDVNWGSGYFSNLAPGIYTVHIRDANATDCKAIVGQVEIKAPELMTATVAQVNVSCFGGSDGQIQITDAKNGSGEYEFSIDGINWKPTSELPFVNLVAGDYTISMRDFNAKTCVEIIKTITITQPEKLTATVNPTNVTCYGYANGKISISSASGGTVAGNYEYSINGLDWIASGDFINLAPGDYTVVMRDAAVPTCFVDLNKVTITEPPMLTAVVTPTDVTCYGANDGIITVSDPKNGLPTYEYSINDGATWTSTSSFTGLLPIKYFVWMRDAKGCTQALDTIKITEPEPLIADVDSTNETCLGNDGTITITNPKNSRSDLYEYSIDNWATWNATGLFIGLASNTYTVSIRDALLPTCERIIDTVKIVEAEPLLATATTSDVTCFGGNDGTMSVTTSQGGSGLYEYSINGSTWQSESFFGGLYAGTYTLTIRDAKAPTCLVTVGSYVINQPAKLFALTNPVDVSCYGRNDGSITMTSPSGGSGTYEYSVNGTDWFTGKIELLIAGTYTVTIRDAAVPTCMASLAPVTINQPPKLFANVIPTPVTCFGGSDGIITISDPINGVGPYQFSLDGGLTWQPEMIFKDLKANTYTLLVIQDANNCIATLDPVEVKQPAKLEASYKATNETLPDTNDGTITVINAKGGSGTYKYSLDAIIWQTNPLFIGLAPGTYTVWVGDANVDNCMISLSVPILPSGSITAEYTPKDVTCFGGNDGSITFKNPVGATNYEYSIIAGTWQKSPVFAGLVAQSSYLLSVRDADNPTNVTTLGTIELGQPAELSATAATTNETLPGASDGSITVSNVTGGTGLYEYSINGTSWRTNPLFAGLTSGTYTVQVRDAVGCLFSISKIIQPAGSLSAEVAYANPLCFGEKGSITISKASGGPAGITYQYSIDGGNNWQSSGIFPGLSAGTYDVTLGDASNPTIKILLEKVNITEPKKLQAIFVNYTPPSCLGTSASFTISAVGGTPQYFGTGDFVLPAGASRRYTISDKNGCTDFIDISVPEPVQITATAIVIPPKCFGDDGTVIISATGGTGNYGKTVGVFPVKPGAKYTFIVRDSSGCQSNVVSGQMPAAPPELLVAINAPASICGGSTAKITVTASGGTPDASGNYTGTGIFDRPAGTYNFTVTDSNGCSASRTIVIGVNEPLATPTVSVSDQPNCIVPTGTIVVTNPMAGTGFEYSLDNGTYTSVSTFDKLAPGSTHSVKVKDVLTGCESAETSLKIDLMPANPPAPVAKVTVIPSCKTENGTVMVTSPTGANYEYIMNGKTQTSTEFVNVKTGTYSITVRNILTGCTSMGSIDVPAVPPSPVLSLVSFENPKCFGETGTITFTMTNTPNGIYVIKYIGGQFGNVAVSGGKATVSAPAGTYNGLSIESNGCTSDEIINVVITQPSEIVITESITEIDLKSNTKGAINITVTGGSPFSVADPYLYKWADGTTTKDIKNLNEGTYVITVTDKNGCTQVKAIKIPAPNFPPVARDDEFTSGCSGASGNLFADNGKGIDYDPENDPFFVDVVPVESPKFGKLTINPDGTFVYLANPGHEGLDKFRYAIYDQNHYQGDTATVFIQVVSDFDGDGIPDSIDPDADGDGILNVNEVLAGQDWKTTDSDGDGHFNWLDIDSDNDGIVDNVEAQSTPGYIAPSGIDKDQNGIDDAYDPAQGGTKIVPVDTDSALADPDGIPDFLDVDSDNDWVPDYIEGHDSNADGKPDRIANGRDTDADGLDEIYDIVVNGCNNGNATGSNSPLQDFDGDGLKDWRDDNDDDDEYLTRFEDLNADGDYSNDVTGHVGHPEYLWYGRDCELFIPDAFSPNDDNIHDYFQIYCIESYPNAYMYIFDQVGNKLYEKEHYGNLEFWKTPDQAWWDGTTGNRSATRNGNKVVPGTYYYVLRLGNGEVKKSFVFVSY